MIVKTIIENTSCSSLLEHEHGLCFYVETNHHKLLFDVGQSDRFLCNLTAMGIDVEEIDTVIISHGHYDHGGGLSAFLQHNELATIYIHKNAFDEMYSKQSTHELKPIGLDRSLMNHPRIHFVQDDLVIDSELHLFSKVTDRILFPTMNQNLYRKIDNEINLDNFDHEQNLIIVEEEKTILIVGCAHNGVLNIMNKAMSILGKIPSVVIGGFHLESNSTNEIEDLDKIIELGKRLQETKAIFYTGHCTKDSSFSILKPYLKDSLHRLTTGQTILFES